MQKYKLEQMDVKNLLKSVENVFSTMPIVPRECINSLNLVFYNFQFTAISNDILREIIVLVLRGFSSKDQYLKAFIYIFLEIFQKMAFLL